MPKNLLLTLAVFWSLSGSAAEQSYKPDDAINHVGENAVVCGVVASAKYATSTRRQPTFLNLQRPYPDQVFTAVIWGADRGAFEYPPESLAGKRICVSGQITTYKGVAEIIVNSPSQIRQN